MYLYIFGWSESWVMGTLNPRILRVRTWFMRDDPIEWVGWDEMEVAAALFETENAFNDGRTLGTLLRSRCVCIMLAR